MQTSCNDKYLNRNYLNVQIKKSTLCGVDCFLQVVDYYLRMPSSLIIAR